MLVTKRRAAIATLLASAAFALPVHAQDVPADTPPAIEEDGGDIIVTAQKREESLQNVPISIQALSTRKLDQLNVTNFNQFGQLLPSVSFETSQPGNTTVYMRGVASGGDGNHSGPLPSVGFYLDEQPITTIGGTLDIHIYDIARIESLAGPQGTLYGASSEAGTIRIITNKPDATKVEGRIDGELNTVAHGKQGGRLEGVINLPVNANIAFRAVGWYQKNAGYIDNVAGTRSFDVSTPNAPLAPGYTGTVTNAGFVKKDFNTSEVYGGRAALKIDLDEDWTATPTVYYQEQKNRGVFGYQPSVGDLKVQRFYPDYSNDRFVQAALTIEGKLGNWDLTYAGAYLDRQIHASGDYTDYAEAYDSLYASAGGIAGYFYFHNSADLTIDPRQFTRSDPKYTKLSQEFRVASPQDERFRIVAGLFYQRQQNDIFERYVVPNLAANLSVNGYSNLLWLTKQKRVDRDYAAFGEASFDITPTLTLTGGGRAFIYDNSLIGFFGFGQPSAVGGPGVGRCFRDANGAFTPAQINGTPCTNLGNQIFNNNGTPSAKVLPRKADGQGFTHRLNLTWKPAQGILLYGTWSRGFRPGGINRRAGLDPYGADYLTNYELGWKTTLFDGAVRLNGAIYQQEWEAFQFAFLGQNSLTQIQNGPDARIRGIEADINWQPIDGLTLTAAAAYTDAKTRTNLCRASDPRPDCSSPGNSITTPIGTRLPITPKFKGNATARYEVPVGADAKAHIQGVVVHATSASSDIRPIDAAVLGRLQDYTTADFALGLNFSRFSVEAYIQNAFDERAEITRGVACSVCTRVYINTVVPRTIGIRAGAKF